MSTVARARKFIRAIPMLAPKDAPDSTPLFEYLEPDGTTTKITLGDLRAVSMAYDHLASDDVQPLNDAWNSMFHPCGDHGAGNICDSSGNHIAVAVNVEQARGYMQGHNAGLLQGHQRGTQHLQYELRRLLGVREPDETERRLEELERRLEKLEAAQGERA